MAVREGLAYSLNQRAFTLSAAASGVTRSDGRGPDEARVLRLALRRGAGGGKASATVHLGSTKVLAVVSGEIVAPFPDRPAEGQLQFHVEVSSMAEPGGFAARKSPLAVEIARIIERGVRDSQAIDTEALCLIAGERVWSIRVDIKVLDLHGNSIDAASLAAISALHHYRRPVVNVDNGRATVVPEWDAEPEPLAIHHSPMCATFALFEKRPGSGKVQAIMDPSAEEESCMGGRITYCLTPHNELCTLDKGGGLAMSVDSILELAKLASERVKCAHKEMSEALLEADKAYKKNRDELLRGKSLPPSMHTMDITPHCNSISEADVGQGSFTIDHLDYNDLHVTGKLREEDPELPRKKTSSDLSVSQASVAANAVSGPAGANGMSKAATPIGSNGAPEEMSSDEETTLVQTSALLGDGDSNTPSAVDGEDSDADDLAAAVKKRSGANTKTRRKRQGGKTR